MKCPSCGAWNQAYMPKCTKCGAPLQNNTPASHAWEEKLHEKIPTLRIMEYESDEKDDTPLPTEDIYDPEKFDRDQLTDELEELARRREEGRQRIEEMKQQASRMRRSVREAEIIRPLPDHDDFSAPYVGDEAATKRRQQLREARYVQPDAPVQAEPGEEAYGYFAASAGEAPLAYDDSDKDAPIYYDGYLPESDEAFAATDVNYMPRRTQASASREEVYKDYNAEQNKKRRVFAIIGRIIVVILLLVGFTFGGIFAARTFVINQGMQVQEGNETRVEITQSMTEDGHPTHIITFFGRENANIYFRETGDVYVIADGSVSVEIPDYMWYDTDTSPYAQPAFEDTMDVTISPYIRYSQEGEQFTLDPVTFTIDVPLSPIYLLNPTTKIANVGVSIFEVRINVELGSTVLIDGTNVSTLIRDTGNVSKNVQVLPVGDNTISISVKSKYCRENTMEIVLHREPQDIQLELDATVMVEHNYLASDEDPNHQAYITGKTEPGAIITVESDHTDLSQDIEDGTFRFRPLFYTLGNNDVIIRASKEGRQDSIITHTVYYMPNADIYTRKAWDLDTQYSDLVNYVGMRKGTIYMGIGTVERIISSAPQLAVMRLSNESVEKYVLLENSSKTTWAVGTKYRIYGDATGSLYDGAPRLIVRYTYLVE